MIRFLKYIFLSLSLCMGLAACHDEDMEPEVPQLPVNYSNVAGTWQLVNFNGHPLAEDTYAYIVFERRDHVFQMYDNLQSMYGQKRTGTYLLEDNEDTETTLMSGFYDNGVGAWNHTYTVTLLTEQELELTSVDADGEVQRFERFAGELPLIP
ncbi:MAG: lipocalin family protein [Bacteroidaceae bacterium]|nr:lipocalin family protein [Bacteroidaceae bacterium]